MTRPKKPNAPAVPELSRAEFDVLRVLWKEGRQSVREVHDRVRQTRQWAYTTTKTVMDRMVAKGLLDREPFHGVALYKPRISRPAGLARLVEFFASRVLETDPATVVALFADGETLTPAEVRELERMVNGLKGK